MNISQLLEALKDSADVLTIGEKLLAGLSVTALSMVVVFIVLVIIAATISLLQKEKAKPQVTPVVNNNVEITIQSQEEVNTSDNMEELVSVITAAIAATTGNSTNNIVVRKIVRSNNSKTSWEKLSQNTTK